MNFAHLASFQAIEFVDQPISKALDIFVCQTSENKALYKMQHSVTVVREEREHDLISSPVSRLFARSAQHYDHTMKHVLYSFICMCQQS